MHQVVPASVQAWEDLQEGRSTLADYLLADAGEFSWVADCDRMADGAVLVVASAA